jgi:hypothetical protein
MRTLNDNFREPVVLNNPPGQLPDEVILEHTESPRRTTSLRKLQSGETLQTSTDGAEVLVLEGECSDHRQHYSKGHYLRTNSVIELSTGAGCVLFIKAHQYINGDVGNRIIDTTAEHHWLPGPVNGITICPLHVFDSESIMLLRWDHACEFKPNLDPQGEELLVISGLLQNRDQLFSPYSWIRNPVEDWRRWHGSTDTLVYYKSGHFPKTD